MDQNDQKKDEALAERQAEGTEKETLEDLEDAFGSSEPKKDNDGNVPSPDGTLDEEEELEGTGPM